MADQSLYSPINPHFFQPLLQGFRTHINIPVAFFSKHVEGSNDQSKTAKLRSDASDKTWLVKIDGLKFTDGWEDFSLAHDLQFGDIIVFRHEGEMVFHVTVLGSSCCEIQYTSSHNNDDSNDAQTNIVTGDSSRDKRVKKNPRTEVVSSSYHSRFVAHVSPSSLRFDRLYLPVAFAKSSGLTRMSGKKVLLLNEEGRSWSLDLIYNKAGMQTYLRPGWRRFCAQNRIKKGHLCPFKLVQKSGPPILRLCRRQQESESSSHHSCFGGSVTTSSLNKDKLVQKSGPSILRLCRRQESESSSHHSCFGGSVTPASLRKDNLYLPRGFVIANGLDRGCSQMVLKNEWGGSWNLALKHYKSPDQTFLTPGWTSFCNANGIKAGDSFKFKLVRTGKKLVLSLCPADSNRDKTPIKCPEGTYSVSSLSSDPSSGDDCGNSNESEEESSGDENFSHHSCFGGSVTPSSLRKDKLYLPRGFVIANSLERGCSEMVLKNERGGSWNLAVKHYESAKQTFLTPGWTSFCHANGIKAGDSFKFKLVRTGKKLVLSLCPADFNREKTPIDCPEGSNGVNSLSSDPSSGDDCKNSNESEEESSGDENFSQDLMEVEKEKNWPRCRGSSSYSQDQFVTLTLTSYNFSKYKLVLPMSFTRKNGIEKAKKVTLLGQDGVKRVVDLYKDKKDGRMRLGKGWREFCEAHSVKIQESFVLELIWEEDVAIPVLKFCTKLNSE